MWCFDVITVPLRDGNVARRQRLERTTLLPSQLVMSCTWYDTELYTTISWFSNFANESSH